MLKELKSHHRKIIQMSFNGFSNNEIAERMGTTPANVSTLLRSPLGQAYLNNMEDKAKSATLDVRKELISMNRDALNTFRRLLDPKQKAPASVQFNTAKDILDRSGYKAPDKLNVDMTFQTKSDEELDAEIRALERSISKNAQATEALSLEKPQKNVEDSAAQLPTLENTAEEDLDPFKIVQK